MAVLFLFYFLNFYYIFAYDSYIDRTGFTYLWALGQIYKIIGIFQQVSYLSIYLSIFL